MSMNYLKHNVWAVVLIGLIFSFIFPALGTLASPFLEPMFMLLMFLSTLDIKIDAVLREIQRPQKTIIALLIIHLLSPIFVLIISPLLTADLYLGLIIASAVSSGISVVFLTDIFGGNTNRPLVITTISNVLSPLTLPVIVFIFARQVIDVSPLDMSLTIAKLVIIPLIAAQYIAQTKWKKRIERYDTNISIFLLMFIIIGILSPVRNFILNHLFESMVIAGIVSILISINFFVGFFMGKDMETKIGYGISTSFKNFTLSTVIAISLFGSIVALPAIMYSVMNSFLLIPMQWFIEAQQHSHALNTSSKKKK